MDILYTKIPFTKFLTHVFTDEEGLGNSEEQQSIIKEIKKKIKDYAIDKSRL